MQTADYFSNSFHAETRILTTIFALIFWDIIFSRVPGAFETKFQACPLDMFEDSFYRARTKLLQHRLEEIENGKAKEYLKRYDDRFRPERIWCIGLSWDAFEQKQLLEIVEVLFISIYPCRVILIRDACSVSGQRHLRQYAGCFVKIMLDDRAVCLI